MFDEPPIIPGSDETPAAKQARKAATAAAVLAEANAKVDDATDPKRKRGRTPPPIPTAVQTPQIPHATDAAHDDGFPGHRDDPYDSDGLNLASGLNTPRSDADLGDPTTSDGESDPEDGGLQITQNSTGDIQGQRLRRAHNILSEQQNAGETLSEEGPDSFDEETELLPSRDRTSILTQFAKNWFKPKTASDCDTAKIKDKDWPAIRNQILLNSDLGAGYTKTLSKDERTINVLKDGKECMSIARQPDKTLKVSSKSPTDVDALIKLFLSTGSKTCNISKAESPEVAAKLYAELTNKGIKVEMSKSISDQLEASNDPFCKQIAQSYLRRNSDPKAKSPTPSAPASNTPPTTPITPLEAAPDTTNPSPAANPLIPKPSPLAQLPTNDGVDAQANQNGENEPPVSPKRSPRP